MEKKKKTSTISKNKKAFHEYSIENSYEAGIVLKGTEIKSVRMGKVSLQEGWVDITQDNQVILKNIHISPYTHGNIHNHDPRRDRQLLLKKREIIKLANEMYAKGMTLVPLKLYFKGRRAKLQIGLARGKKLYDKRQTSKEKTAQRDIEKSLKYYK